jgi:hypothetical protein
MNLPAGRPVRGMAAIATCGIVGSGVDGVGDHDEVTSPASTGRDAAVRPEAAEATACALLGRPLRPPSSLIDRIALGGTCGDVGPPTVWAR